MAENLYHVLSFLPATETWEMPPQLELLAQRLVQSGKLRINADTQRNFVRYEERTFTVRELTDPALKDGTNRLILRHVAPAAGAQGLADLWQYLRNELKKARGVAAEKEMQVARVLVQSAHPSVIQLLIGSGAEIFVSYSHNVADLMPVHAWQGHGANSGMQATEEEGISVYISAGGDPFFEGEQKYYVTDGFPALARMVIIAGQELGHFSDLRRGKTGIIGRHSTDSHASRLRANPVAGDARLGDIRNVAALTEAYRRAGLPLLRRAERGVSFYHNRLRYSPPWFFYQAFRLIAWGAFMLRCRSRGLIHSLKTMPYLRLGDAIEQYLIDMAFNLAPDAEVYRNPDPLVEEAISVIEAVARVPQQVHKWGYSAVFAAWPGLFRFYYDEVIPACMASVSRPLGPKTLSLFQKVRVALRRRLRARPGYYP